MITNLFESSEDDIKVIHHRLTNPSKIYHEKTTQDSETQETDTKDNAQQENQDDVKETEPNVSNEIKKEIETEIKQISAETKKKKLVTSLFNTLLEEYKNPFSSLPSSVRSSIDTCFKQIETAENKDDIIVALDDFQETIKKTDSLSFNKRAEIFKKVVSSDEFSKNLNKIGKNNGYKLELAAFKTTGCYKQLSGAITQVFDSLQTVSFDDLKSIDAKKLENAKNYTLDVIKTQLDQKELLSKESKEFGDLLSSINPESKKNPKEKVGINSVVSSQQPKLLQTIIKKCWKKLNDIDKTVLSCYQNDEPYSGYVGNDHLLAKGISSQMTPEGIVCLCGMAADKYLPEGEDNADDEDIVLVLEKFVYKGGNSTAIIHYGQPKEKAKDSQFFEMRVDPGVKIKNEKGRVELVIRTFDTDSRDEDQSHFVTKRGKRVSVYETLRMLFKDEGNKRRR